MNKKYFYLQVFNISTSINRVLISKYFKLNEFLQTISSQSIIQKYNDFLLTTEKYLF